MAYVERTITNLPSPGMVTLHLSDGSSAVVEVSALAQSLANYDSPPVPVPTQVSRLQGLLALHDAGLLDTVNAIVAQSDARTQLAWNSTPDFHRDSAALNAIWGAMGKTQAELDDLFRAAAQVVI